MTHQAETSPVCMRRGRSTLLRDPYLKLAAAVLQMALRDAERNDQEAVSWLSEVGTSWGKLLAVDVPQGFPAPGEYVPPAPIERRYIVIEDPDADYGLLAGLVLAEVDVKNTLEMGHFTPGTVLQKGNFRYRVEGAMGEGQRLTVVDGL